MSFRTIFAILLVLPFFFLSGCGQKKEPVLDAPDASVVVANYNEGEITVRDIMIAFQESHSFDELIASSVTPSATELVQNIAREIALNRFLAQQARDKGLDHQEDFNEYRQNVINDELYQRVLISDVLEDLPISEETLQDYYKENKESLYKKQDSDVFMVQGLYIDVTNRSREEARQLAQEAYQKLEQGESFKSVATQYSDAPPTKRGGEMAIPPGLANPEIEERIRNLEDGAYTEPFFLNDKFYIYRRVEYKEPEYLSFEDVRYNILSKLTEEKKDKGISILTHELSQKFDPLINSDLLNSTDEHDPGTLILSIPDVYELSLGDFLEMAKQNNYWSTSEQREFLSLLVMKSIYLAEAKSRGWDTTTIEKTLSFWENQKLANNFIVQELEDQYLETEKIVEFYETNKDTDKFNKPDLYDLYHIFFPVVYDEGMTHYESVLRFEQARQKALQALEAINKGRAFEEEATLYASDEETASRGGFIGQIGKDQINIAFREVSALQAGEISSSPHRIDDQQNGRYGYELFYVKDVQEGGKMTFTEVKNTLGRAVAQRKAEEVREKYLQAIEPFVFNKEMIHKSAEYLKTLQQRPDLQVSITRYIKE